MSESLTSFHALEPFEKGPIKLRNRFVLAPMTTYSSQMNGEISEDELPWLERRAKGGFAIVMTACSYVESTGKAFAGQWSCSDDFFIPSLKRVSDVIKGSGGFSVNQIHHGGRMCPPEVCGGTPVSASAVAPDRPDAVVPREMTELEILETIRAFGEGARRSKEAGFDAIEIHGANTYLIQQFVSPHSNRRTDSWNADGLKFVRELVTSVREAVGPAYPVGYRLSPEEVETPGIRMDRTEKLIELLLELKVDWIHVSLRDYQAGSDWDEDKTPLLQRIATQIAGRTTVIGVGSIKSGEDADGCLDLGADLVAVARAAVSEPDFVARVTDGGPIRLKVPQGDFRESRTIPNGLAEKINSFVGWFERE